MEEQIRANAALAVRQLAPLSGIAFGYNAESVKWLEGYVERLRAAGELGGEEQDRLADVLGSFLGECVIRCYGGSWRMREGTWCVAFDDQNVSFPFEKVAKQMRNGVEGGDGIFGFFEVIPVVFERALRAGTRKPWWRIW